MARSCALSSVRLKKKKKQAVKSERQTVQFHSSTDVRKASGSSRLKPVGERLKVCVSSSIVQQCLASVSPWRSVGFVQQSFSLSRSRPLSWTAVLAVARQVDAVVRQVDASASS